MSRRIIGLAGAASLLAVGCGPQYSNAFSHHFLDNQEVDLAAVMEQLPAPSTDDRPTNSTGRPIAVASTQAAEGASRQIIAWGLDSGEQLWAVDADAATQPEILGDVVLTSTRDRLRAFDLSSGRELWHADLPDLAYVGAGRDGDTIFWAATVGALGGARRVGHVVAVDARSGGERWRHEVQGVFGRPAAKGGLVFVPWERQNIAILDALTGVETARLRSTDDVVAWAFDHPTGIYYGGQGMYRLTHRAHAGTRTETTYMMPALPELPRQPDSIWPDGYVPRPGTRSARGRIRVYFNPAPAPDDVSIAIEGDTYYFVYYRYVFAYGLDGTLRWTRILEQDVANAEAMPHGLLTFGEQGQATLLDRDTGNDRWAWNAQTEIASVDLDAAGFDPSASSGEARPLRQSLNELVLDPDNRLVAARAFAISLLGQMEEPEITRDLLDLYQQRAMPGALKEAIRVALRGRRSGEQYLMEALARRYDYLQETEAPPLEAIVPALLAMEHTEAVPQLITHLMDHETPAAVLPELVDAIVRLGGAEAVPALRRFLILYREDSLFAGPITDQQPEEEGGQVIPADPEARALARAAQGIFEHGGPEGRELLSSLAVATARLHEPVRDHIAALYQGEQDAAARAATAEEQARQAALAAAAAEAEAALPGRLTQEQINATFHENADTLRECIADELERNERLAQVRFVFILSNDGRASEVTVAPRSDELVACLQPRVAAIQFPRFQQRRMRASFTVSIRGGSEAEGTEAAQPALAARAPEGAPWFWYEQERARLRGVADRIPEAAAWWDEREAPVVAVATPTGPETFECPPGMAEEACRQQQAGGGGATGPEGGGTSGGGATASSGGTSGGTTASAGGGTTASAGGGTTASAGGGTTASAGTSGGGTSGGGTSGSGTAGSGGTAGSSGGTSPGAGSGGGTPWWAAATSDDDEEEEDDDED
ncbi:MAG: PQQ-binding-like beta-propeller repeat protein [Sandaracinaceae bacterium]|nr:PQQ-binding-like beta-propeller repeat protein [Sandaracinaceae bacterium]